LRNAGASAGSLLPRSWHLEHGSMPNAQNRKLNPVVERFIAHLRDFTRPMRDERAITKALGHTTARPCARDSLLP
jgi:hypothetical protein